MGTEYNKHHLSECMKIVILLKGGRFEIFYDSRCFAMFHKFLLSTHFTNRANEKEICLLKRDSENNEYHSSEPDVEKIIQYVSQTNLLIYSIDSSKFELIYKVKEIVQEFANKIDIVNMNNIPIQHTIELLKNKDRLQQKIVDFIKNADLYLDNLEYEIPDKICISKDNLVDEKVLVLTNNEIDLISLQSICNGMNVPSVIFDSTGTKKIIAISSYVVEALKKGRILVVDDIDSNLHFKLTKTIVSLFNNELNCKGQIIFTLHDINQLDCNSMFRKEQIWFINKEKFKVSLFSLSSFTAKDGVRDTSDIIEKYKKGKLSKLPDPKFDTIIRSLLQ